MHSNQKAVPFETFAKSWPITSDCLLTCEGNSGVEFVDEESGGGVTDALPPLAKALELVVARRLVVLVAHLVRLPLKVGH